RCQGAFEQGGRARARPLRRDDQNPPAQHLQEGRRPEPDSTGRGGDHVSGPVHQLSRVAIALLAPDGEAQKLLEVSSDLIIGRGWIFARRLAGRSRTSPTRSLPLPPLFRHLLGRVFYRKV